MDPLKLILHYFFSFFVLVLLLEFKGFAAAAACGLPENLELKAMKIIQTVVDASMQRAVLFLFMVTVCTQLHLKLLICFFTEQNFYCLV